MPLKIIRGDINKLNVDAVAGEDNTDYKKALEHAYNNGCESIAFPMISSGINGCTKEEALKIAVTAINDFINERDMEVLLVVSDEVAAMDLAPDDD